MPNDKGLSMQLPPPPGSTTPEDIKNPGAQRFKIQVNSSDALLVEEAYGGRVRVEGHDQKFILNNGARP